MSVNVEEILHHKGGLESNDLTKIINLDTFETQNSGAKTKYYNLNDLNDFLLRHKKQITMISLNIESINAKHEELKIIIDNLAESDLFFDIICLHETWLSENSPTNQFELPNYQMFQVCTNQCFKKEGLITYVRNGIHVSNQKQINNLNTWEGPFMDL